MTKPFGDWLRDTLIQRGSANNKLAKYTGAARGTVSKWINNIDKPSADNCYKIAEYLDREPDEILARVGILKKTEEEIRQYEIRAEMRAMKKRMDVERVQFERVWNELFDQPLEP